MGKKTKLFIIGVSIIILLFLYCKWSDIYDTSYSVEGITIENEDYLIRNSETALIIGSALLKENIPEGYEEVKKQMVVVLEDNDIWYVYNEHTKWQKTHYIKGGGIYVKFYAKNGEIISIGVND